MEGLTLGDINQKLDTVIELLKKNKDYIGESNRQKKVKLVKVEDAALITGYKKKYIYYLTHHNSIPFHKVGHSIRFDPDELDAWMRAGRPSIINETIKKFKK